MGQLKQEKDECRKQYESFCQWEGIEQLCHDYGIWLGAWHRQQSEIVRLTAEVETAEARLVIMTNSFRDAVSELDGYRTRAETAEAQLADLRAMVRPGVDEIRLALCELKIEYNYVACEDQIVNADDVAKAIHDILPPVPKVLTVDEIYRIVRDEPWEDEEWQDQAMQIAKAINNAIVGNGDKHGRA